MEAPIAIGINHKPTPELIVSCWIAGWTVGGMARSEAERGRQVVNDGRGRSADRQWFGAGRSPRRAAIVTRSGSESALILRMT